MSNFDAGLVFSRGHFVLIDLVGIQSNLCAGCSQELHHPSVAERSSLSVWLN